MARSRSLLFLLALLFPLLSVTAWADFCYPAQGRVDLTLAGTDPANAVSPVYIAATATTSCNVDAILIYVDGQLQWRQRNRQNTLIVQLPLTTGSHWIQVKVWTNGGTQFTADATVNVTSQNNTCFPGYNVDNYVWLCSPARFDQDSPFWLFANVRSDTAPLVETDITIDGVVWARAYGLAASRPQTWIPLAVGVHSVIVSSSNTAGAQMRNSAQFQVRTNVTCQAPIVTASSPTPDTATPLGQPLVFFATADAGRSCKVTAITVYVDGQPAYRTWGQSFINGRLWMPSGVHRVTVQAWNDLGQYGRRTFNVNAEENLEGYCIPPTTPGVMLCQGSEGPAIGVGTSSDPASPIAAARIYVNGVKRADYYGAALRFSFMGVEVPLGPVPFTFRAVAWDTAGRAYTDQQTYYFGP